MEIPKQRSIWFNSELIKKFVWSGKTSHFFDNPIFKVNVLQVKVAIRNCTNQSIWCQIQTKESFYFFLIFFDTLLRICVLDRHHFIYQSIISSYNCNCTKEGSIVLYRAKTKHSHCCARTSSENIKTSPWLRTILYYLYSVAF